MSLEGASLARTCDFVTDFVAEEVLDDVRSAEAECAAANVEENDYTIFTTQDLEFELELLRQSVSKKIAFIDNQVCAADMHLRLQLIGPLRSSRAT